MVKFQEEAMDYSKAAVLILLPGIPLAILLGMIGGALQTWQFVMPIIYALLFIWAVPKLPRQMDTFWEVLIVTFLLMGIAGFFGMMFPSFASYLGWISIISFPVFLSMVVIAVLSLAILDKYTDWL